MACAQFNYAVFVCGRYSHIWCVCVCVCVPRAHTHTHTPTPPSTLSPTPTRTLHMSSRACIPKVICICVCEHGHSICTSTLQHSLMRVVVYDTIYFSRPQVERQYPPNLSILISGGKETNRDSLSSGERSGRSPSSESGRAPSPCPELWSHGKASLSAVAGRAKVPWKRAPGRVTAPSIGPASRPSRLRCCTCPRVGLFGNAALSGW